MTSRHNLSPNPSAKNNTTGWSSSGTLTQASSGVTGMPRTTATYWQSNGYVQTPTIACVSGDVINTSFYLQNDSGFSANGKTIYIAFTRSAGGDDFSQTATRSFAASGSTSRVDVTGTAPALATGCYLVIDSINGSVGGGMHIGCVLAEKVGTVDTYFDGDSTDASWDGADGNSTSTLTPVTGLAVTVWDGAVEQPATVTVWDGAVEQPASVTEIAT